MKPWVVQIFWPLITHSSPSSSAFVLRPARSDPASGSLKPWHQAISPERIFGRKNFFCSSVPHCRMVGPTSVSPKKSARSGAPARANSSFSTTACMVDRPLPPYSVGQVAQIQPPSNKRLRPLLVELHLGLALEAEVGLEPARREGALRATGGSRGGRPRRRADRSDPCLHIFASLSGSGDNRLSGPGGGPPGLPSASGSRSANAFAPLRSLGPAVNRRACLRHPGHAPRAASLCSAAEPPGLRAAR